MDYNLFDLDKIVAGIGHVPRNEIDDVKSKCIVCGRWVTQEEDQCLTCNTPVVWVNSYMWKKSYGNPRIALSKLDGVEASTVTGQELIDKCNVVGFPNKKAEQDWATYERRFGLEAARSTINYVFNKTGPGSGGMAHAVAAARRRMRENPRQRTTKVTDGKAGMW